jgi:hypothetical protein
MVMPLPISWKQQADKYTQHNFLMLSGRKAIKSIAQYSEKYILTKELQGQARGQEMS